MSLEEESPELPGAEVKPQGPTTNDTDGVTATPVVVVKKKKDKKK